MITDLELALETKGERTRKRILELAIERFGERGYRAASVSEVARSAGLTQAAVYAYFNGKEDLFDAAVDADAAAVIDEAQERSAGTEINAYIPTLLVHIIACLDDHPLARRVLGGQEPDVLPRLVNLPALARITRTMADMFQQAQRSGEIRQDIDPSTFADGVETVVLGLLMALTQVGGIAEPRRQVGVMSLFEAVLRPPS